jgi:hypothetical protein
MVKTLEIAISKISALPEAAQEQLARELLDRVEALSQLRADIEIGIQELDADLGQELDVDEVIRQAREQNGRAT